MNAKEIIKSKSFKIAALIVGFLIIALASFGGGIAVGLQKAKFSYKFGENYERNFLKGPGRGPMGAKEMGSPGWAPDFRGRGFRNPHGLAGTIISIIDNQIIIKDRDNQENTVVVYSETLIKKGRDTISLNDLKNNDQVVVMGQPSDDGTINADLIRVF